MLFYWYMYDDALAAWSGLPWVGHLPLGVFALLCLCNFLPFLATAIVKAAFD